MIRRLRVLILKCREQFLLAQVANGEALLADHRERLNACHDELRRLRTKIALTDSARNLLSEALRSKATR